ncbi:MAG: sulfite exporter TauE/SafE family protein [Ruminococcaceae bacterium]|nr:sulfite exporter TauE/SafE family protein [Oscillospiraceae bacterium]
MLAGYPLWTVALICVGVFVASLIDAIGGGGGLISLPVYLMVGLPAHYALGTNKLSACLGTVASTARYIKNGYVNWPLAVPSIFLAIIGSHFGARLQLAVNEKYLRYVLIVVLLIVAAVMLKKKSFPETEGKIDPRARRCIVWLSSLVIGIYDGFYGPGTGTFLLIAFCRLAKMDLRTASGNVKVVNQSSNIGALATSLMAGKVLIPIGLIAAVFAFGGQYIGAGLMMKNGTKIVTPVILTVLVLLIIKLALELAGVGF